MTMSSRKESVMFESDICWCSDSLRCLKTDCFRHLSNKDDGERIFTCGSLMGSEYCLLHEDGEDEKECGR